MKEEESRRRIQLIRQSRGQPWVEETPYRGAAVMTQLLWAIEKLPFSPYPYWAQVWPLIVVIII